jgi:hypothetical protein
LQFQHTMDDAAADGVCDRPCVPQHDDPELIVPPELIAGAWANAARVRQLPDEIASTSSASTPFENRGIVVARVAATPWFVGELADSLQGVWQTWVRNSKPPEAPGEDG